MSVVSQSASDSDSYISTESSHEKRLLEREAQKTVDDVSRLVSKKLETYMNYERRAERFDPSGIGYYRTTVAMHKYDYLYRVLDATKLDQPSKEARKQKLKEEQSESSDKVIHPHLNPNSRRVVLNREADRLTEYANKVFEKTPVAKLHMIHRYRPSTKKSLNVVENGKVQNYSRNVGAALMSENYVQFYLKEGLGTGNAKKSPRLQKLQEQKKYQQEKQKKDQEESRAERNESSFDRSLDGSYSKKSPKRAPENMKLLHSLTTKEDDEDDDHDGTNQTSGIVMDEDDEDLVDYVYEDNDFTSEEEDEEVMQMTGTYEDEDKESVAEDRQSARLGRYDEACDDDEPRRSSTPYGDRHSPPASPPPRAESRIGSNVSSKTNSARSRHSSDSSARSRVKSAASHGRPRSPAIKEEEVLSERNQSPDKISNRSDSARSRDRPHSGSRPPSQRKESAKSSGRPDSCEAKEDTHSLGANSDKGKEKPGSAKSNENQRAHEEGDVRPASPQKENSRPPSSIASNKSHHSRTSSKEDKAPVSQSEERPASAASSHRNSVKQEEQVHRKNSANSSESGQRQKSIEPASENTQVIKSAKDVSRSPSEMSVHQEINNNKVSPYHSRKGSASSNRSKEKASAQLRSKLSSAGSVRSIQNLSPQHSRSASAASKRSSVGSRNNSATSNRSDNQKTSRPPSSVHSSSAKVPSKPGSAAGSRPTSTANSVKSVQKSPSHSEKEKKTLEKGEKTKEDDDYDDDFEDEGEGQGQTEKKKEGETYEDYDEDFEEENEKEQKKLPETIKTSQTSSRDNASITSETKPRPASAQPQTEADDNNGGYDDDFESNGAHSDTELEVKKKSTKDDGDTTSIHTYVSVEHVSSGV
ncbi:uncharacterized protein DDB_G0283697 [Lingula anatina]|uniref:Uncharacterized protein DDB_G0283697 n=1 Tax=Lingula anatina TaxID=7574 RepID=A0A1S3GZK7_LINAN|nr:uncharacterized protein DDB_G0283697 [Lingula anatina]|eukprot:XP_013379183.1 uncharacterized protein DDB_G0283697 [Lingula anatina]